MNFPVDIPTTPKELFETPPDPLRQILGVNHPVFFIDRIEYPETGGIYIYKFSAELIEKPPEEHKRVLTVDEIDRVEAEESEKGFVPRQSQVYVCEECNKLVAYFVSKMEFKNRVDLLYPVEGFPDPKIMPKINEAKRFLIGYIKFFADKFVLFSMSFLLFLPFKYKVKFLEQWLYRYNQLAIPILTPYMQEKYHQNISKELNKFVANFLEALGIRLGVALKFARIFGILIEFDSAYNLFLQDIFSETTKEKLNHPRQEFQRLILIFQKRTSSSKLKILAQELSKLAWILAHPRVKKAFKKAVSMLELKNLQLTEGNRYHVLKMDGYDFMGRTVEDRAQEYFDLHKGNPPIPHYI